MKCIMLLLSAFVVSHEAKPFFGFHKLRLTGLGNRYRYGNCIPCFSATGFGMGGLGLGYGIINPVAIGLGTIGSGYIEGGRFGDSGFNSGASGYVRQGFYNSGRRNFYDRGQQHSKITSINHAENTDNHDIGGGQAFDTGVQTATGFNQFGNGFNEHGNGHKRGQQMTLIE